MQQSRVMYECCPLCERRNCTLHLVADCSKHPLYRPSIPDKITWMRCTDCGHVFTDGIYSDDALKVIFANTHDVQKPGADFEGQRITSAKIVEKVAQHAAPPGRWLDVGFGNASLLFTAEEWGYTPIGLDLRLASVEVLRRLGFEAHCESVETFKGSDSALAVVSMADVLEHMPFPKIGLQAARRLLRPGGVLFLSMPNYDCTAWRLLDLTKANPYWGELEHYHNFSRQRLYALLEEMGFEPANYGISERYRVGMEIIARRAA